MTTAIMIIVIVVVLLVAAAAVVSSRRRQGARRHRATEIRSEADAQLGAVDASSEQAAAAQARAEAARAEAERSEQEAAEAQRRLDLEQATWEDALREADAIDPDVDHRADDYRPETPPAENARTERPTAP